MKEQFEEAANKIEVLLEKKKQLLKSINDGFQNAMYKTRHKTDLDGNLSTLFTLSKELSELFEEATSLGEIMFKSGVLLYISKPRYDGTHTYNIVCPKEEVSILASTMSMMKGDISLSSTGRYVPVKSFTGSSELEDYCVLTDFNLNEEDLEFFGIQDLVLQPSKQIETGIKNDEHD